MRKGISQDELQAAVAEYLLDVGNAAFTTMSSLYTGFVCPSCGCDIKPNVEFRTGYVPVGCPPAALWLFVCERCGVVHGRDAFSRDIIAGRRATTVWKDHWRDERG